MIDRIAYYIDLFISLCGFDGSNDNSVTGWIVVALSMLIVIYAFYQGVSKAIWPGERDTKHVKYQIFDDEPPEEVNRAH